MDRNALDTAGNALARFLRHNEEEESLLQIGKKKPKKQITNDEKLPSGRSRWFAPADFTQPTPMVDRPRTIDGSTSFHFSYITISKEAVPTVGGKPIEGKFGKQKSSALKHSKYIERDGAAEVSQGAAHAAYVERPGAVEHADRHALLADAMERRIADSISEDPTAEETAILGKPEVDRGNVPSIFSNISDDEFERQEYWRAVERCERNPQTHEIILDPEAGAAWWAELETTKLLDSGFQHHALMVAEKYRQYLAHNEKAEQPLKKFVAEPYPVKAEQAGKIIEAMRRMPSYREQDAPFTFKSGRGGRTQIRFVAELPHELTPEDRALIVQNFVDHISSLEERRDIHGNVYKVGLMYTAVIHAPDAHNDSRNYHLHVVAHDRPAKFLEELGMWDFEVEEQFNRKGELRTRFPRRQNKITEVCRATKGKGDYEKAGRNFIPALRNKFAEINNTVLRARGIRRKLDPRRYTEMGIDRTPTEHLGTKAASLEAIGVSTVVGRLNAISIWGDAERQISRAVSNATKANEEARQKLDGFAKSVAALGPENATLALFRRLAEERYELAESLAKDRAALATFELLEAKAKSRATRTHLTCTQFLADIDAGRADNATAMMKTTIRARSYAAQNHLSSIDMALAPYRDAIEAAVADILRRQRRLHDVLRSLDTTKSTLKSQLRSQSSDDKNSQISAAVLVAEIKSAGATTVRSSEAAEEVQSGVDSGALVRSRTAGPIEKKADGPAPWESEKADSVLVQPFTIAGLPIVQPSIAPEPNGAAPKGAGSEVPDGLSPLRPRKVEETVVAEPEIITMDITRDSPEPTSACEFSAPGEETTAANAARPKLPRPGSEALPIDPPTPLSEATEIPVDDKASATLLEALNQEAPAKPAAMKADYESWDKLMKWIADRRIPIKSIVGESGDVIYSVPLLSQAEQKLLNAPRFGHRTNSRLAGIEECHTNEIQRIIRWVKTAGQNSDLLILEDRTAKLGGSVKQAVRTMMKHWGSHPAVGDAIRAENARRIEVAKAEERAKSVTVPVADFDLEDGAAQVGKLYPPRDQVFTEEVAAFTELLRRSAPDHLLRSAAERVCQSAAAREDIYKHTQDLAEAFETYSREGPEVLNQRSIQGPER